MAIELRKAERKKVKLRIGIGGPAGSGKTHSALLLANGMAPWEKIVLIDTENGSGELYSHLGPYNVVTIAPPFTPEVYIEAIRACERAGMEVIIIDSITHEWDGPGGCLEIVDKLGGKYQDWNKVTPRHKMFIDAILQSRCQVITTVRKKQDYAMQEGSNGKMTVKKMGMKEITREGFEYEVTLNFDVEINHFAKASKDRTGLFMDRPEFVITQNTGKELVEWANSGADNPDIEQITKEQDAMIKQLAIDLGTEWTKLNQWVMQVKKVGIYDLNRKQVDEIITKLQERLKQKQADEKRSAESDAMLKDVEVAFNQKPLTPSSASTPATEPVDEVAELDKALGTTPPPPADEEPHYEPIDQTPAPLSELKSPAALMRQGMRLAQQENK